MYPASKVRGRLNPNEIKIILTLALQGVPYKQIAAMRKTTKSAVAGIVWRSRHVRPNERRNLLEANRVHPTGPGTGRNDGTP